jgi:glycosyltransferase involved in cell wall biosynthesis
MIHDISMIDEPLVSVVMVTRNVERFLPEAIESVLSQSFRDFEFIIVDFGSTDRSKEIVMNYAVRDSRVSFCEIPQCGLAAARNAACSLAKGRYIAIQDADDISLPERLLVEVEFIRNHPEVGLVGSWIQRIDQNGKDLETTNVFPAEDWEIRQELQRWNPIWQPTVLILKAAFVRAAGYREALPPSEDYDLWLRIAEHYKCANLRQVLVKYRIHSQQLSFHRRKEQILCSLAARASMSLRREGIIDPVDRAKELTPALLAELGVSQSAQDSALAEGFLYWIREGYVAREYDAVFEGVREIGQLLDRADMSGYVSEARLILARVYWKQNRLVQSGLCFGRAVLGSPRVAMRALHILFRSWI